MEDLIRIQDAVAGDKSFPTTDKGAILGKIDDDKFKEYLDEQLKAAYGGATAYVSPPSPDKGGSIYGFGSGNA